MTAKVCSLFHLEAKLDIASLLQDTFHEQCPTSEKLRNKKVCVDLSCWLVQFHNANHSSAFAKDRVYLKNLFHRIRAILALNYSLVFVTDGAIPVLKLATYRCQLGSSSNATREQMSSQPSTSLRRNKGSEFSRMIKEAKHLRMALGIPCLDGVEEAEAQCALLNLASLMSVSLQTQMHFSLTLGEFIEMFSQLDDLNNIGCKRAFIVGVADDNGYGWAIAKALAVARAEILVGTYMGACML
ncbi:hypothetical protein ABZP36_026931 [Zizania latifolia]